MAKPSAYYQFGDIWCSGGFTSKDTDRIVDTILNNFDIPCWPELMSMGEQETLTGFWVPLYQKWLESSGKKIMLDQELLHRPGIKLFHSRFKGKPLNLVKGQMIGPGTLRWTLAKKNLPMGSDDHIIDFLVESAIAQIQVLSQFSWNVVLTLDEPAASFYENTERLWREFFLKIDKYRPYGLGLHCCGSFEPQWLEWPWQVVHLDAHEYLQSVEKKPSDWQIYQRQFFSRGSWLVGGVVSSNSLTTEPIDQMVLGDFLEAVIPLANRQLMFSTTCGIDCVTNAQLESRLGYLSKVVSIAEQKLSLDPGAKGKAF